MANNKKIEIERAIAKSGDLAASMHSRFIRDGLRDVLNSSARVAVAKEGAFSAFRGADDREKVILTSPDWIEEAWAWADGRGKLGVHPNFDAKGVGRRGILGKRGDTAHLKLRGEEDNFIDGWIEEKDAVLQSEDDFSAEVYVVAVGDEFRILLIDLLLWGDNLLRAKGFEERRRLLDEFLATNLKSSRRFSKLEVTWVDTRADLEEAVRWGLAPEGVTSALIKSGTGAYPTTAPSPDWYELIEDREPLSENVEKEDMPDAVTLLAAAALGYRIEQDSPPAKDDFIETKILKADEEQRFILGVVLEPLDVDAQADIMIPQDIEKTAHNYLRDHRVVGLRHKSKASAVVVESYIAPVNFELDGQAVKKGSWLLGVIIDDPLLWTDVKEGRINGFSVGGFGRRERLR